MPGHEQTPESKTETPKAPATQVGGDEKELCSHLWAPLQSTRQLLRNARHANADRIHLLPAAAREVRHLQIFFAFPQREEEEETLEDDDAEEEDRNDVPEKEPEDQLGCWCWCDNCEKWSFLPFCWGFSLAMAFQIA